MGVSFDARGAALAHAGRAGDLANALACGLVYVGDQIKAAAERPTALQLVLPTAEAVAAWRALEPEAPIEREVVVRAVAPGVLEVDGVRHELRPGDSFSIPTGVKGS